MGQPQIYGFALGTLLPKAYECFNDGKWQACSRETICSNLAAGNTTFYKPLDFFRNWATDELDLICDPIGVNYMLEA